MKIQTWIARALCESEGTPYQVAHANRRIPPIPLTGALALYTHTLYTPHMPRGAGQYRKRCKMPKKIEVVEMPPELAESEACENINGVQKRQWRKWNQQARFTFNSVFNLSGYQASVKHPLCNPLPEDQWLTLRWNFAWLAAEAVHKSTEHATEAVTVMPLFADCLRKLYAMAGVEMPKQFDPNEEAVRLALALGEE